jgi:hypothetical protein
MLIYIGTPMMAVGLWKRDDINRIEASLYRKIMRIGNDIPNAAILNTMTSIRLAGEVIQYLSREAWNEFRRQNRVTKYFDQIEDREVANNPAGDGNNDAVMENCGGSNHSNAPTTNAGNNVQHR